MDRRTFLMTSGRGLGLLCLTPVGACVTPRDGSEEEEQEYDPGPYEVDEHHRFFPADGSEVLLDVHGHGLARTSPDGTTRSFGGLGDGAGEVNHPIDAALHPSGRLYVVDRGNSRVQVFNSDCEHVATIGGHGAGAGALNMPHDLLIEGDEVYVCDTLNHRVQVYDGQGRHLRSIGEAPERADAASLNGPRGIARSSKGELHVIEAGDASVQVFSADGRPLRRYGSFGEEPGRMIAPRSITADGKGRMLVSDPSSGYVHVFAESGAFLGRFRPRDGDGTPVIPVRVTLKPDGVLYIWTDGHGAHESGIEA